MNQRAIELFNTLPPESQSTLLWAVEPDVMIKLADGTESSVDDFIAQLKAVPDTPEPRQ